MKAITMRIEEATWRSFKRRLFEDGLLMNQFVREAIRLYLEKEVVSERGVLKMSPSLSQETINQLK